MKNTLEARLARDPALAAFVDFMRLFGGAQQELKTRMQAASEEKLGPLHMRMLSLCQGAPGCTQQHLVQTMGRDKGQVARLARDLEEHGLLSRAQDEKDGRLWRLTLTAAGQAKYHWFAGLESALAGQMFGTLAPDDFASVNAVLKQLAQRLGRESGAA